MRDKCHKESDSKIWWNWGNFLKCSSSTPHPKFLFSDPSRSFNSCVESFDNNLILLKYTSLCSGPNASGSGSCLPNYPGFEKDVFKVVRDFFLNTQVPLLPPFLTPLLIKVFCGYFINFHLNNSIVLYSNDLMSDVLNKVYWVN